VPKILLAADLHCYYSNYGRVLPSGEHSRLAEWRQVADALVQAATSHRVDVAVFPGDFFTSARPSPIQVLAVADLFRTLESTGIKVIGCPGNHDLGQVGQPGPCELVAEMGSPNWCVSTPISFSLPNGLQISVLPSVKPAALNAEASNPTEAAQQLSQLLLDIAQGLRVQLNNDLPKILVGHWTISGAVTSSGQLLYGGTEPVLPLAELLALDFDAYLFGHIHKPQVLNEHPFVGYAGALQRVDFGEEKDPRGCWIVDLEARTHEWVDLPALRFWTVNLEDDQDVQAWLDGLIGTGDDFEAAKNAIVRVKYRCSEELAKKVDHQAFIKRLEQENPHLIAGVFPEIIRSERGRETSLNETTKPLEALEKWLALRGDLSEEFKARVTAVAEFMLKEVA
jgi:exonuclease SbcD